MNTSTANGDQRKRLTEFLKNLWIVIDKEAIQSEADLVLFIQVEDKQGTLLDGLGYEKKPGNETLLEILGYSAGDVDDHPQKKVIVGQIRYSPDYILKRNSKPLAVVDLKTPDANLDHERWMGQIYSYCRLENAPIGFLFNGKHLRVFINVEFKGLTKYADVFKEQPVAEADVDNERQMVDLLLTFAASSTGDSPLAIARELANKRLKELKNKARQRDIGERLKSLLLSPSDSMLNALADINDWGDISPKPDGNELIRVWAELAKVAKNPKPLPRASRNRN